MFNFQRCFGLPFLTVIGLFLGLWLTAPVVAGDASPSLTPPSIPSSTSGLAAADYRLTPGDLVRFEVFNQPDLTVTTRIPEAGGFSFR